MLSKYHFKIKYISKIDNKRADILSRKAELQGNKKPLSTILKLDKDRKVRYNHLQLTGTHKVLKSLQEQQIQKAQAEDLEIENYKNQEIIYIPKNITKEFVKDFHANII